MNKTILVIATGVLAIVGIFGFIYVRSRPVETEEVVEVEEMVPELPFDQRPVITLTPRSDGHWLKLSISGLSRIPGATTMDFDFKYEVPGKPDQGTSARLVKLSGLTVYERDILLGSESSGKFRYDEGVERGTISVKFRDSSRKLVGGVTTDFRLYGANTTTELSSKDGSFTYKLTTMPKKGYFVVIPTVGMPEGLEGVSTSPMGVFASESAVKYPGVVNYSSSKRYSGGKWEEVKSSNSPDLGIFTDLK
jgi:hypothetical protein